MAGAFWFPVSRSNKWERKKCRYIMEKSVFGGIAIGKISVYQKKEQQVKRVKIDDPEQEMAQL